VFTPTDPATLRAEIARSGRRHYQVAAHAEICPSRLSTLLRGSMPVPEEIARRILDAVATAPQSGER